MQNWKRVSAALVCTALVFGTSIASHAVEMKLAGIKLGSKAEGVLKKFGNPTRTTVGSIVPVSTANNNQQPGSSPADASSNGYSSPMSSALNALNAAYSNAANGSDQLPTLPGMSAPGQTPPQNGGQQSDAQESPAQEEVTWTYDMSDGTTIEFIISETGRVIQITVGGDRPYAGSKTTKGIKLGSYYKDVIFKYGYPESQRQEGRFLRASYADKQRCVFTFLGKKLVGITIALKTE